MVSQASIGLFENKATVLTAPVEPIQNELNTCAFFMYGTDAIGTKPISIWSFINFLAQLAGVANSMCKSKSGCLNDCKPCRNGLVFKYETADMLIVSFKSLYVICVIIGNKIKLIQFLIEGKMA